MSSIETWLTAAPNFRDIGGLMTPGGSQVRHDLVFRSGALDALDVQDLDRLRSLGIKLCCDLRSADERHLNVSRWPGGIPPRLLETEVLSDVRAQAPWLSGMLMGRRGHDSAVQLMHEVYRSLPKACVPALQGLFRALLQDDGLPVIVHCTAGKDRTGFVIAMLLHSLDVRPADISADYLRSNEYCDRAALDRQVNRFMTSRLGLQLQAEELDAINSASSEYLDAAYDQIRRDHGSVRQYLASVGVDDDERRQLREKLLNSERDPAATQTRSGMARSRMET